MNKLKHHLGREHRVVQQLMRLCLIALVASTGCLPASAQINSALQRDLVEAIPDKDGDAYKGPYGRWRSGAPVSLIVVTGSEVSPCTNFAISKIRHHWKLIREQVLPLSKSADVVLQESLPTSIEESSVVLTLPLRDARRVETSFDQLMTRHQGKSDVVTIVSTVNTPWGIRGANDNDGQEPVFALGSKTGVAIESGWIRFAYNWDANARGISIFADDKFCRDWPWPVELYNALGAYNFNQSPNALLRRYVPADRYAQAEDFFLRLFLQALNETAALANVGQIKESYGRLLADPHLDLREFIKK